MKKIFFTYLLLLAYNFMFGQKEPKNISIQLEKDSTSKFGIEFILKNNYSKTQKICTYFTPLEGFYGDFFDVKDEHGEKIEYTGIKKKRKGPGKGNYIIVPAGDSVTVSFDISEKYNLTKKTIYYIYFMGNEYVNKLPNSNTISIKVD